MDCAIRFRVASHSNAELSGAASHGSLLANVYRAQAVIPYYKQVHKGYGRDVGDQVDNVYGIREGGTTAYR